jgi:hypothetical protein
LGNTTRRQPISFGIPAAPDYKFLNITDFAGLNITDNPFTAKANTASDALNVYVDENNALTTRPRLEKIEELLLRINQPSMQLIDVFNTKLGILVHGLVGDEAKMYLVKPDSVIPLRTASGTSITIPKVKTLMLEKENFVYLLGGNEFFRFDEWGFASRVAITGNKYPKAYVPIRRSIDVTSEKKYIGADIEPLNLITDLYTDAYFWDGRTNISSLGTVYGLTDNLFITSFENKYHETITNKGLNATNSIKKYLPKALTRIPGAEVFYSTFFDGGSATAKVIRTEVGLNDTTNFTANYLNPSSSDLPYFKDTLHLDSTDDGEIVGYCYSRPSWRIAGGSQESGGVFVYRDNTITKLLVNANDEFESKYSGTTNTNMDLNTPTLNNDYRIQISNDGNVILTYSKKDILKFEYNINTKTYDLTRFPIDSTTYECIGINLSADGSLAIAKLKKLTESNYSTFHKLIAIKNDIQEEINISESYQGAVLSRSGRYLCVSSDSKTYLFSQFNTNNEYKKITCAGIPKAVALEDDIIYTSKGYYVIANDWEFEDSVVEGNNDGFIIYATSSKIYTAVKSGSSSSGYTLQIFRGTYSYDKEEPLLHITKYLLDTDPEYTTWLERRNILLNSKLTTSFDNNLWFCNGNKLFYTSFDDITYVPMTNYTVVGDESDITGFNLANDNLLIAYKKDRLYQISPATINNIYTYTFEETKNTVGNEAFGSTIVTTLTERPLQITRDGIFALNQLKNVQSSDRISVLISEHINKKWLAENDELIYNCKTLNRLYWTYFILSDDKLKITKIYLLDNRTSSWYYWELPIIVTSAFIDDDITKFVDIDGNLYKLETKDAFNKYNPEITEYYDDGQKLIKWYWQSQILPLGTINYSKRLVNTTFIVSDTEMSDEYGLNYSFKIYRKLVSESNTTTVSDNLNYVQSVTKKTMIPRFNFIQIKLSNIEEEDNEAFNNNKFRLIGLGLKYVLLEGLY